MHRYLLWILGVLGICGHLCQAAPAKDVPLEEGKTATIECQYTDALVSSPMKPTPGTYHYQVYIPAGYNSQPQRRYPCLFVHSPGGNAGMPNIGDRLKREGWVVIMLVESKNGPWGPIVGNFLAAYDDAVKRLRLQPGLLFATGFSGGARASSVHAFLRPGFAGVILQGAGFWSTDSGRYGFKPWRETPGVAAYLLVGSTDGNRAEIASMRRELPKGAAFTYQLFTGTHEWAPAADMEDALDVMLDWAYFNSPYQAQYQPMYLQRFNDLLAAAEDPQAAGFAKYELLDQASRLATARKLNDPAVNKQLPGLKKDLATLAKDPEVKKELAARQAYQQVRDGETLVRLQTGTTEVRAGLAEAATRYAAVVSKHPNTVYAKKAQRRIEVIKVEAE